ncbi:MAG: hypothetical protein ACRERC_20455 [Candidatus Binatia bacterium]
MRPRIDPWWFLAKLVVLLIGTYLLWSPLAPYYAQLLLRVSQGAVWLTEFSSDPQWQHPTQMLIKPEVGRTALLFYQTHFPEARSGIPAEWVMANLVLLVPLMLATPVVTWGERWRKLGLALAIALLLQVIDVVIGVKVFYAQSFPTRWGPFSRDLYQFLDAFVQSWDTQLFPFAIWAGINFRQILPERLFAAPAGTVPPPATPAADGSRAERRRRERGR